MREKARFFTHTSVIWALFILGNACLIFPIENASKFTVLGYICAVLLGFIINLIALLLAKWVFCENTAKKPFKNAICSILYVAAAAFAAFCAADTFKSFIFFVKAIMLNHTALIFVVLIFGLAVLYFGAKRQEDILKFFLVAFWFVILIILFFFIANSLNFKLSNIFIFRLPDFSELYAQTKPYILNPFIPSVLLCVYNVFCFGKPRISAAVTGYFLGAVILGLCIASSVLLFGHSLASELAYPYSSAISTVSIGRLFTRLDGFSYYVYFISALAKITVCIFIIKEAILRIKNVR